MMKGTGSKLGWAGERYRHTGCWKGHGHSLGHSREGAEALGLVLTTQRGISRHIFAPCISAVKNFLSEHLTPLKNNGIFDVVMLLSQKVKRFPLFFFVRRHP